MRKIVWVRDWPITSSAGIFADPGEQDFIQLRCILLDLGMKRRRKYLPCAKKGSGGNIYLGASTIPATYILPRALSDFNKTNTDIHIY